MKVIVQSNSDNDSSFKRGDIVELDNIIILCDTVGTDTFSGTILQHPQLDYLVGEHSGGWDVKQFKKFHGVITLEQ